MNADIDTLGFHERESDNVRVCDGCATKFSKGDYALVYFTDLVWVDYQKIQPPIEFPQELYCFDCYPNEIPIPHTESREGFSIVRFEANSKEDKSVYEEVGILNKSPQGDGIKWNPVKTFEKNHILPVEEIGFGITTMQIFSTFRRLGIDLRGFVSKEGLNIPEEEISHIESLIELRLERSDRPLASSN